jgi:ATP synthase protein I
MTLFVPPGDKKPSGYAQIALLAAVPAILVAGPLIGFFGGKWLDGRFGTEPWLMIAGVILGFVAAGREIYHLVKKSQALEERSHDK